MVKAITYKSMISLIVAVLLIAFSFTAIWRDIDGRAFDTLSTANPMLPEEPGITVIAIDEPSMAVVAIDPCQADHKTP